MAEAARKSAGRLGMQPPAAMLPSFHDIDKPAHRMGAAGTISLEVAGLSMHRPALSHIGGGCRQVPHSRQYRT